MLLAVWKPARKPLNFASVFQMGTHESFREQTTKQSLASAQPLVLLCRGRLSTPYCTGVLRNNTILGRSFGRAVLELNFVEAGCKPGVVMKAECLVVVLSPSRVPQTKIRRLNPPRACKKLSTSQEQAWIFVHNLPSLLPAKGQYVFMALIKSARSARDERQLSPVPAWSAEGGRKHKPARRNRTESKIQMSSSKLTCPMATLPTAASLAPAADRDPGPSPLPLILQSTFNCRGHKGSFYRTISICSSISPYINFFCFSVVSQGCIWDYE